jgi:hypothetical protein
MNGHLRRGKAEDKPTVADIDVREPKDVAEKSTVGFRLPAVDYRVCADDHVLASSLYGCLRALEGCARLNPTKHETHDAALQRHAG